MASRWIEVRDENSRPLGGNAEGFSDREVRKAFVRKVYCLLAFELLILLGFCSCGAFIKPLRQFVYLHRWAALGTMIGCMIGGMIPLFALICYENVRKSVPLNYIIFNIFVVLVSIGAMFLTATYEPWVFLAAFGTTLALVLFLTLISFLPCLDVTGWGLWFFALGFIVMMYGSIAMLLYVFLGLKILILVYAGLSVVLSCVYLVFVTQLILGGRKVELDPDEYILGCILLFTQILSMLLSMMTLFNN